MAVVDKRQMNRMRQEAIRRSQEMHKRSMVNASHYSQGSNTKGDMPPEKFPAEEENRRNSAEAHRMKSSNESQPFDLLDSLFHGKLDSDKLMILLLMAILIKEGADIKLIIALGYILL